MLCRHSPAGISDMDPPSPHTVSALRRRLACLMMGKKGDRRMRASWPGGTRRVLGTHELEHRRPDARGRSPMPLQQISRVADLGWSR